MTAHAPHTPASAQATSTQAASDTAALDAIATILGTTAEWDSDTMSDVSNVVSCVRPGFGRTPNCLAPCLLETRN